jgi:hypothetical protein
VEGAGSGAARVDGVGWAVGRRRRCDGDGTRGRRLEEQATRTENGTTVVKEESGLAFCMIKLIIKELSIDGLLYILYPLATACRERLTILR